MTQHDIGLHEHEWIVFSTAIEDCCLMLQCVECGAMGTVDDPTSDEWSEAFHAPSKPYHWTEEARVRIRHEPPCPLYVIRSVKDAPTCDCPPRSGDTRERKYERFPAEIMRPDKAPTPEEKTELEELADLVDKSDLCSRFFPFYVQSYQAATGAEPTGAVRRIASRIEEIDRMGLHCTPAVVARVLRMYAGGTK